MLHVEILKLDVDVGGISTVWIVRVLIENA